MKSKNKPAQTAAERQHVSRVASLGRCIVCGDECSPEIHEFEQGQWFTAIPACVPCHRGPQGWHGDRMRWRLRRVDMLAAINSTHKALAEAAR